MQAGNRGPAKRNACPEGYRSLSVTEGLWGV